MRKIKVKNYRFLKLPNGNVTHIQANGSPFLPIIDIKENKTNFEVKTPEFIFVINYEEA